MSQIHEWACSRPASVKSERQHPRVTSHRLKLDDEPLGEDEDQPLQFERLAATSQWRRQALCTIIVLMGLCTSAIAVQSNRWPFTLSYRTDAEDPSSALHLPLAVPPSAFMLQPLPSPELPPPMHPSAPPQAPSFNPSPYLPPLQPSPCRPPSPLPHVPPNAPALQPRASMSCQGTMRPKLVNVGLVSSGTTSFAHAAGELGLRVLHAAEQWLRPALYLHGPGVLAASNLSLTSATSWLARTVCEHDAFADIPFLAPALALVGTACLV